MKLFLMVASLLTLAVSMWTGYEGHTGVMSVGFAAFFLLLMAAHIEHLAEFGASGGKLYAKTREVVRRAEIAITDLQLLAQHVATLSLSLIKRQGRLGGYSDPEEAQMREAITGLLVKLGLSQDQIKETLHHWHEIEEFDYVAGILGNYRVPSPHSPALEAEWKKLRGDSFGASPAPDVVRDFLRKHGYLTPEREELIKDYEYFLIHRKHRRPAVWADRQHWPHMENPIQQ